MFLDSGPLDSGPFAGGSEATRHSRPHVYSACGFCAQEGLVPFNIGVTVCGDVAIGLWFGSYKLGDRLQERPAAAYAFHTAFVEAGAVERIAVQQLDVTDAALFPPAAARSFFIDIKLDTGLAEGSAAGSAGGTATPGGASEADGDIEPEVILLVWLNLPELP